MQRVSEASVTIGARRIASIHQGLAVLVGVRSGDTEADVNAIADKLSQLRIFADNEGKLNLSVRDVGGEVLVVSQFTLHADTRKGRRPSFAEAAPAEVAEPLVLQLARALSERGLACATGQFGARMEVALVNDGPVTIILETEGGKIR